MKKDLKTLLTFLAVAVVTVGTTIAVSMPSKQKVLAAVLVLEAGGLGEDGMRKVAQVIANRSVSDKMTPTQVVTKRNQFKCLNHGVGAAVAKAERNPRNNGAWPKAYKIAGEILNGKINGNANGYLYFAGNGKLKFWR